MWITETLCGGIKDRWTGRKCVGNVRQMIGKECDELGVKTECMCSGSKD